MYLASPNRVGSHCIRYRYSNLSAWLWLVILAWLTGYPKVPIPADRRILRSFLYFNLKTLTLYHEEDAVSIDQYSVNPKFAHKKLFATLTKKVPVTFNDNVADI